jgi:hypothetical protein
MKKLLLWILAFLITVFILYYQRVTGPTYPMGGEVTVAGETVSYQLLRTHETTDDCPVRIDTANPVIQGQVEYKRFKTDDPWTRLEMQRSGDQLTAYLPKQPSAGKLAYRVILSAGEETVRLAGEDPVVMRYKDPVPTLVTIFHVFVIFAALLFSTRTGFEALKRGGNPRTLAIWTVALLILGGMILGPIMQKYAFGAFWTGFPLGKDLTDTKTLFALLGWIIALIAGRRGKPARGWYLAAFVLTLIVFLIPHSVLGSELDYSQLDEAPVAHALARLAYSSKIQL